MKLDVYLTSGAGNLFASIDGRELPKGGVDLSELARRLTSKGVFGDFETDGLIVVRESDIQRFDVEFFNPDGSSGMMCGNGARCAARLAEKVDLIDRVDGKIYRMRMASEIYEARFSGSEISVKFPPQKFLNYIESLDIEGENCSGWFADVGTRHFVIDFAGSGISREFDFEDFNLPDFAVPIRRADFFAPEGTNVNYYRISDGKVRLRTFEKGVERETQACGTGAVATAFAVVKSGELKFPVELIPRSGERLKVDIDGESADDPEAIYLIGPAKILDKESIEI